MTAGTAAAIQYQYRSRRSPGLFAQAYFYGAPRRIALLLALGATDEMPHASWVIIVKPGSVLVSGCAGWSVTTRVDPGCIIAVTRRAVSGAKLILFIVSEARRAEAAATFVPDGNPIASHLR